MMTIENKDRISEINITLKQLKAIMDLFTNEYTSGTKDSSVLNIDAHFESFVHAASVISDLIYKAKEQASELEKESDKEDTGVN